MFSGLTFFHIRTETGIDERREVDTDGEQDAKQNHFQSAERNGTMMQMTIGQLDDALNRETPLFIQSSYDSAGDQLVELTNYLRGNICVLSWAVSKLYPLENRNGLVAQVQLPPAVVAALEE